MQAILGLRTTSRPSSPAIDHSPGRTSMDIAKMPRIQSLTGFHRRSTNTPPPSPGPSLVQDGTYLDALGLRLNEAASKALVVCPGAGPDSLKGRKPLPAGRGRAFAVLIEM